MNVKIKNFTLQFLASVLLSAYPVLYLFGINAEVLIIKQMLFPMAIVFAFSAFLFLFLKAFSLLRVDIKNTWISVPLVTIFLFSYGHMHAFLAKQSGILLIMGRHRFLLIEFFMIGLVAIWGIHQLKGDFKKAGLVFLITLNLLPFYQIFNTSPKKSEKVNQEPPALKPRANSLNVNDPDIYFIVLDMYPSEIVLSKFLDFDNKPFLNTLDSLGFITHKNSMSNYSRTLLSLCSTLNMEYIHQQDNMALPKLTLDSLNYKLTNNKVVQFLKSRGYNYYWFEGGYIGPKSKYDAGEYYLAAEKSTTDITYQTTADNDFFLLFVNSSIILPFVDQIKFISYDIHRKRFFNTFNSLKGLVKQKDKKFVFAHIMSPHPPFIFDADGRKVNGVVQGKSRKNAFYDQLEYLNSVTSAVIKQMVLENNGREKIIILQGDHGMREITPSSNYNYSEDWVQEAFGNLNSIYFSDQTKRADLKEQLPAIASVNTFRYVFNQEFNADMAILENNQYYTDFNFPLKIYKVANK